MLEINDSNMRRYQAYGVSLCTDLELRDRLVETEDGRVPVTVVARSRQRDLGSLKQVTPPLQGHGRDFFILTDRQFAPSSAGQNWCFQVKDIARFYWTGGEARIEYEPLEGASEDLLAFWLVHIFLPLWFTLEGTYELLHACAVEIGGKTALFMAPSMGGKSTLTNYFIGKGHALVSDDKIAVIKEHGRFLAVPSHPNHRPYRKFEDLGNRVDKFASKASPIGSGFYLRRAEPGAPVEVNEIEGHRKFAVMRPGYLFDFDFLKKKRLEFLADMASKVPFFELSMPWSLERLDDVYVAVCNQYRTGG